MWVDSDNHSVEGEMSGERLRWMSKHHSLSYLSVVSEVVSNVTVRPKGWEKATLIPSEISVIFHGFSVIFHQFVVELNISLLCNFQP